MDKSRVQAKLASSLSPTFLMSWNLTSFIRTWNQSVHGLAAETTSTHRTPKDLCELKLGLQRIEQNVQNWKNHEMLVIKLIVIIFSNNRPKVFNNVLEVIGMTPMVKMNHIPKSLGIKCQMCKFWVNQTPFLWKKPISWLKMHLKFVYRDS